MSSTPSSRPASAPRNGRGHGQQGPSTGSGIKPRKAQPAARDIAQSSVQPASGFDRQPSSQVENYTTYEQARHTLQHGPQTAPPLPPGALRNASEYVKRYGTRQYGPQQYGPYLHPPPHNPDPQYAPRSQQHGFQGVPQSAEPIAFQVAPRPNIWSDAQHHNQVAPTTPFQARPGPAPLSIPPTATQLTLSTASRAPPVLVYHSPDSSGPGYAFCRHPVSQSRNNATILQPRSTNIPLVQRPDHHNNSLGREGQTMSPTASQFNKRGRTDDDAIDLDESAKKRTRYMPPAPEHQQAGSIQGLDRVQQTQPYGGTPGNKRAWEGEDDAPLHLPPSKRIDLGARPVGVVQEPQIEEPTTPEIVPNLPAVVLGLGKFCAPETSRVPAEGQSLASQAFCCNHVHARPGTDDAKFVAAKPGVARMLYKLRDYPLIVLQAIKIHWSVYEATRVMFTVQELPNEKWQQTGKKEMFGIDEQGEFSELGVDAIHWTHATTKKDQPKRLQKVLVPASGQDQYLTVRCNVHSKNFAVECWVLPEVLQAGTGDLAVPPSPEQLGGLLKDTAVPIETSLEHDGTDCLSGAPAQTQNPSASNAQGNNIDPSNLVAPTAQKTKQSLMAGVNLSGFELSSFFGDSPQAEEGAGVVSNAAIEIATPVSGNVEEVPGGTQDETGDNGQPEVVPNNDDSWEEDLFGPDSGDEAA